MSALDAGTLLRLVNRELVRLRVALSRDHGDAAAWEALGTTASWAQHRRACLRPLANLLHVERAAARGRIHGRQFASFDLQCVWLAKMEHRTCGPTARAAGLPTDATLAMLRAGMLTAPAEIP